MKYPPQTTLPTNNVSNSDWISHVHTTIQIHIVISHCTTGFHLLASYTKGVSIDNTNSSGVDVDTNMNIKKSVHIISKCRVAVEGTPKSLKAISLNAFCVMNGTVDSRTKETKAYCAKEFITSQPK